MTRWLLAAAVLVLLVTAGGAGAEDTWESNTDIVSGLGDIGEDSAPAIFQKDGIWYLISGNFAASFHGFEWTGSTWAVNNTIISGLGTIDEYYSNPTVFQKDGVWYLIAGRHAGTFAGFEWTGSTWTVNNTIISGLGDIGECSDPDAFQKDGVWYFITGRDDGYCSGFEWTGGTWVVNNSIVSGTGDIGSYSKPEVFQRGEIWYLIIGDSPGTFHGFKWAGSTWMSDSDVVSGLGDIGTWSTLDTFEKDGILYLISGETNGVFFGFNYKFKLTDLTSSCGKFWVNHSWEVSDLNRIDSYNVSINSTWHNNTLNHYFNNTLTTYGDWSNITVCGYNSTDDDKTDFISEDVQLPYLLPATPNGTTGTWDYYWINHTWLEGDTYGIWCSDTDSYNVSVNDTWYNNTTNLYYNNTGLAPHVWSNISVFAYNNSNGINETGINQYVQIGNQPITITNTSDREVYEGINIYVDYDFTDLDNDVPSFSCNRSDLFADFNTTTGQGNWTAVNGSYNVAFTVSDGWGSESEFIMSILVHPHYPTLKNLQNITGNFWINHTWEDGDLGDKVDSHNISVNGTWYNNTISSFFNDSYSSHAWQNISVYAYNNTSGLSNPYSDEVQIPNNPITITNTSDWNGDIGDNIYIDYDATDLDGDAPIFSCSRLDWFTDFNSATGTGNHTAIKGDWTVGFGVSDSYGSVDNYTMALETPYIDGCWDDSFDYTVGDLNDQGLWYGDTSFDVHADKYVFGSGSGGYGEAQTITNQIHLDTIDKICLTGYIGMDGNNPRNAAVSIFNSDNQPLCGVSINAVLSIPEQYRINVLKNDGYWAVVASNISITSGVLYQFVIRYSISTGQYSVIYLDGVDYGTYTAPGTNGGNPNFIELAFAWFYGASVTAYYDDISVCNSSICKLPVTNYILLKDTQDHYIENAKVMISDDTGIIQTWQTSPDGILNISGDHGNRPTIAVKTFDGVFIKNVELDYFNPISIYNFTIPLNYNINVVPVDEFNVPLHNVFVGISEYAIADPQAWWGFSMSGSQYVPVTNCSGFSMCDLIAEKGGYVTYEETALNWTSKSALIKDYRHTATLTKE